MTETSTSVQRPAREWTGRHTLIAFIAFFMVVFAVNGVMIKIAVSTFAGLEAASSYKAGLQFSREIAASREQSARNWKVAATFEPLGPGRTRIAVTAADGQSGPLAGYEARLILGHPGNKALDHEIALDEKGSGSFSGTAPVSDGLWDCIIELSRDGERYFRSRERITLKNGRAIHGQ